MYSPMMTITYPAVCICLFRVWFVIWVQWAHSGQLLWSATQADQSFLLVPRCSSFIKALSSPSSPSSSLTFRNSIAASAVCAFNLSAISQVFNGPFKYQENSRSAWLPYPNPNPDFQVRLLALYTKTKHCSHNSCCVSCMLMITYMLLDQGCQTLSPEATSAIWLP